MAQAAQQPDLSVLSAKRGLVYLSANDWALIADKATRLKFQSGEQFVHRSRKTNGIYVLLKGTAAVQIPAPGMSRTIGPGEVCGEVSFLDEQPATADIVANSDTEVFYLDRATLQSLFELFPHLGSRFYHSLAAILSSRLRESISQPAAVKKS